MGKMIELVCSNVACGKRFDYESKNFKYNRAQNPDCKFYCGKDCRIANTSLKHKEKCFNCSKYVMVNNRDWIKSATKRFYCSQTCRAFITNGIRVALGYSTKNKVKCHECIKCNDTFSGSIHLSTNNKVCNDCCPKIIVGITNPKSVKKELIPYSCLNCPTLITSRGRDKKYCNSCRFVIFSATGLKNSQNRKLRSKNEILFSEMLLKLMPLTELLTNVAYFPDLNNNLWDADIIIPDMKLAIHWNGTFHYRECGGSHSLTQTKRRDRIKAAAVSTFGYTNYTIKDLGKFSIKKVEKEIERFLLHFFL